MSSIKFICQIYMISFFPPFLSIIQLSKNVTLEVYHYRKLFHEKMFPQTERSLWCILKMTANSSSPTQAHSCILCIKAPNTRVIKHTHSQDKLSVHVP